MSARTAVETIQGAIDKMEAQRDATLGGRFHNEFASIDNIPAGDLIVTLHRTIDAQLAILRVASEAQIIELHGYKQVVAPAEARTEVSLYMLTVGVLA